MEISSDISELIYQKGFLDCLAVFRPKRRFVSKSAAARFVKDLGFKNAENMIDRMCSDGMIHIRKPQPEKARNAKWQISANELVAALVKIKCDEHDVKFI